MKASRDYMDDLLIRMAFHSCAIEGNTISLPQVGVIFLERMLPSGGKSVWEFYEVENHKRAFEYIEDLLAAELLLSLAEVKEIHSLLTDRLQHDRGQFKSQQNAIRGAEFKTASPFETPQLMEQWVDNTNYRLDLAVNENEYLEVLADTHIQFERIHPFSDGNGRTGRMILLFLSMKYLSDPVVIRKEWRGRYMEFLGEQDVSGLVGLFKESIAFERERIKEFGN
ncbi:Fic family protein [Enterococcus asini]|uniref:Fic family protein n=1 Tax=Enterococcus asini TaxID=57732 RepID=UPI00241FE06A|nr:Fic family protein [Enterococcus asini]